MLTPDFHDTTVSWQDVANSNKWIKFEVEQQSSPLAYQYQSCYLQLFHTKLFSSKYVENKLKG